MDGGQDFAKLIMTGWVPARLVLGISIRLRHDDRTTTRQSRWSSGNVEVAGWTALVGQSRRDARDRLEADVRRIGAEGVVIATMQLRVRERDCPVQAGRPWPSCPSTRKAATLAGAAYRRRHTWQEREAAGTLDGCGMRIFRRRNAA